MDILITTGVTTAGVARQVQTYLAEPNPCLAIGGDLPWLYPDVPPPVDLGMVRLPNCYGYVPIGRRIPVVPNPNGLIATADNRRWTEVSPVTHIALRDAGCRHVLVEVDIDHNLLPLTLTHYQSVGLYLGSSAAVTASWSPGEPNGYLDTVQYLGELPKVQDVVHVVQILREF